MYVLVMSTPLSELLSCSICTETYTQDGIRIPYLLSCGHTFCYVDMTLLKQHINGAISHITCPHCRKMAKISRRKGIDATLSKNYTIIKLIPRQQQQRRSATVGTAHNTGDAMNLLIKWCTGT